MQFLQVVTHFKHHAKAVVSRACVLKSFLNSLVKLKVVYFPVLTFALIQDFLSELFSNLHIVVLEAVGPGLHLLWLLL